jgi:hypothetical protein
MSISIGDHLVTNRTGYTHHGLYIGNNKVIHYTGKSGNISDASTGRIKTDTLANFAKGKGYFIQEHQNAKYRGEKAVNRAKSRLGEKNYDLFNNNCEQLINWAIDNDHLSQQVDNIIPPTTVAQMLLNGTGAVATVSSAGAVAGLSGAGVMSGLAAIGFGSVVGGMVTLGGGAGLGSALLLNNTVLKDNENLPKSERDARKAGRKASVVGAGAATAGGIATVSAAGTTAGLSAAGITSGLAAVGGSVGGGMVAGTAIVAAAPVAAAAAIGYGIYKLFKDE